MTVPYMKHVGTANRLGHFLGFIKIMFRWRGSLMQNIYQHLIFQLTLYFTAALIYWLVLTKYPVFSGVRFYYERLCLACEKESKDFPIKLMIGFFVNQLSKRWWLQFQNIAFPDHLCYKLLAFLPLAPDKERDKVFDMETVMEARHYRRTVTRYMNLAIVETLRSVSLRAAKRFPTHSDLVKCGMLTEDEKLQMEIVQAKSDKPLRWLPCVWCVNLFREMYQKKHIPDLRTYCHLVDEMKRIDQKNYTLKNLVWVNFPLAYTQVILAMTYSFFACLLLGSQYISPEVEHYEALGFTQNREHNVFAFFGLLQFIFYLGWLDVAKVMLNPFGEDPDDFDVGYIIDRNLQASLQIVDGSHAFPLPSDPFNNEIPKDLPHTKYSEHHVESRPPKAEQLLSNTILAKHGDKRAFNLVHRRSRQNNEESQFSMGEI